MTLSRPVADALAGLGLGGARVVSQLSGGSIHAVSLLEATSGRRVVVKESTEAPPDLFAREADGLHLLRSVAAAPPVPEPLAFGPTFLILDYLEPAPRAPRAWIDFGLALAALHARTGPAFGAVADNYLGPTPQPNPATTDGHRFFAEQRLAPQLARARAGGRLSERDLQAGERLMTRLIDLIPVQPASLIHGDLWSGNAIVGPGGALCLIDPAAHYGWAEADLAMTALFGGFPNTFYEAYASAIRLEPGWRERFQLYNLYHLLNHLNLFGAGYLGEVRAILDRFGAP